MKTSVILRLSLAASLAAPSGATVIWRAEPPPAPAEAPVLRVAASPLSRDLALRRFRSYGGSADAFFTPSPRGVVIKSGDQLYLRDATGTEFFGDVARMMAEKPGEADPIPDAQAVELARSFFDKTNPLMFREADLLKVRHLMNQAGDLESGRLTPKTQDETIVQFGRMLEGIRVIGPLGDGASVHVDNFGSVVGFKRVWRNAILTGEKVPILPWEEVKAAFLRRMEQEMDPRSDAIVQGISFGYFARPEGQQQGYLQPVYLFDVVFPDPESQQNQAARQVAVPAVQKLLEPLELPDGPPTAGDPGKIVIDVPRPQLPGGAPVYGLIPNPVNTDVLLQKARLHNIAIDSVQETPLGLVGNDKTRRALLAFDANGGETFAFLDRMMQETPGELPPIPDGNALEAARKYIGELGDVDPAELGTPVVRHLMHQMGDTKGGDPEKPTQDESIVEYRRQLLLPGYPPNPCIGPGALYQVHLDNAGVITGHNRVWRQVGQQMKSLELRNYGQIEEGFIRGLASELGRNTAVVRSIEYGLYFRGRGYRQEFLQPAVLYMVDIVDPDTGQVTAQRNIAEPAANEMLEPLDDPDASDVPPAEGTYRDTDGIPALLGDITGDGRVTTEDVADVLRMSAGLKDSAIEPALFAAGDVVPSEPALGDGRLQMGDALRILRSIYGLDDLTPGV